LKPCSPRFRSFCHADIAGTHFFTWVRMLLAQDCNALSALVLSRYAREGSHIFLPQKFLLATLSHGHTLSHPAA